MQKPLSSVVLPASGDLPEFLACSTAEESRHPECKFFHDCIRENSRAGLSLSSLVVAVYVLACRWKRVLLVRRLEHTKRFRICTALHTAVYWAFRLSFRLHPCTPKTTGGRGPNGQ
jgi:hypothetical protein